MNDQEIETEFNRLQQLLQERIEQFETLYNDTIDQVFIKNRKLKECLGEQPELQITWESEFSSIHALERRAKTLLDTVQAKAFNKELQNSYKQINMTEARNLASANDNYIRTKRLYNEIVATKDDVETVLSTVRSRQYALKDLTNAITAGVSDHII